MKKLILIAILASALFANDYTKEDAEECIYNTNLAFDYQRKTGRAFDIRNFALVKKNIDATIFYLEKALVSCESGTEHHKGLTKAYNVFTDIKRTLK